MKFNLIPILLAISIVSFATADHFLDDDLEANDLIAYLAGNDAEELDHYTEETDHHDMSAMEEGLKDTTDALADNDHAMDHNVDEIDVLELGDVIEANRNDDVMDHEEDDFHPHFEVLSAGYGRKQQNMYNRGKPKRSKGYAKPGKRPSSRDHDMPDPMATSALSTKPPSFDDFENSKPQNDGNCLNAVNKERQAAGVPELTNNQTLVNLAAKHSAYMAASQVLSHDGFWSYRFDAVPAGVIGVGELVVADDMESTPNGPAKRAVDKWMGSMEHKALLLRPDMFILGCSTAQGSDGRFYATAIVCSK